MGIGAPEMSMPASLQERTELVSVSPQRLMEVEAGGEGSIPGGLGRAKGGPPLPSHQQAHFLWTM